MGVVSSGRARVWVGRRPMARDRGARWVEPHGTTARQQRWVQNDAVEEHGARALREGHPAARLGVGSP